MAGVFQLIISASGLSNGKPWFISLLFLRITSNRWHAWLSTTTGSIILERIVDITKNIFKQLKYVARVWILDLASEGRLLLGLVISKVYRCVIFYWRKRWQPLLKRRESQELVTSAICKFTKGGVGQSSLSGSSPLIAVTAWLIHMKCLHAAEITEPCLEIRKAKKKELKEKSFLKKNSVCNPFVW